MRCFNHLKVLAIDSEYLIAMDVERILLNAFGCSVTVATPSSISDVIIHNRFDVAVLDHCNDRIEFEAHVDCLRNFTSHLVFSISDQDLYTGIPGFEGCPVVMKPFIAKRMEAAIASLFHSPYQLRASG